VGGREGGVWGGEGAFGVGGGGRWELLAGWFLKGVAGVGGALRGTGGGGGGGGGVGGSGWLHKNTKKKIKKKPQ